MMTKSTTLVCQRITALSKRTFSHSTDVTAKKTLIQDRTEHIVLYT